MKSKIYSLLFIAQLIFTASAFSAPAVKLTTPVIAASAVNQGTSNNIVYAVNMAVTVQDVSINTISFTLSGSHDANDLTTVAVYFNAAGVTLSGATFLGSATATFAGPHTYSINVFNTMTAGSSGYYIIVANLSASATDNHTIVLNGATNPVTFGYSVSPSLTDNQSNKAGALTIQAADITLTTAPIALADLNQGATNNIVYASKMNVTTEPATVNNITFTLTGTHDNNDLTTVALYYNATGVTLSGATFLGSATATFAAPHTYSINVFKSMVVGEQGYYMIVANVSATASDNKTIIVDGAANPMVFGFTTAPNITNNQSDKAKKQTIQAPDVTLTSSPIALADLNQGSTNNIVYAAKMKVITEPGTVNNITFTLSGSHDNNDLTTVALYYNATGVTLSGATFLGSATATFAAPHTYSVNVFKTMVVGEQGYYMIVANVSATATDNHTILINGATDPMVFGFTTAPNITDGQSNKAKKQTIQAPDVTLTSSPIALADLNQGSTNNIVYAAKMKVVTEPATVNNITFTLSGSHDNNDLTTVALYYNATGVSLSGATFLGSATATFAAPHTYSVNVFKTMVVGEQGYYMVVANINATATDNHTIIMNGATDPVEFTFTTAPNITNNQSNNANKQTIQSPDITLTTPNIVAGNIAVGSSNNIVYATFMKVTTEPLTVNNIQFNLSGNYGSSDLTSVALYYNTAGVTLSGATFLGSATASFAGPHTYSINVFKSMVVDEQGYYMVVVNVSSSATIGKTVRINGATDPAVFGFTTAPNITDNQSNNTGIKTISATGKETIAYKSFTATDKNVKENSVVLNSVYPNPANASLNYSFTAKNVQQLFVQLANNAGKIVLSQNINTVNGSNTFKLDVSHLTNGMYHLIATNNAHNIVLSKQVLVQH